MHIAKEIASGLGAAHAAGLIHRDLKASNVIVDEGLERVRILDFGIAKPFGHQDGMSTLTGEGGIVGTVQNMSPEQALGQPLDPRSDLFSLGVLLYEMLGGENPFGGQNPVETLSRICSWQQQPLSSLDPSIPEELSEVVDRLLKKEPKLRPSSAREVIDLLSHLELNPSKISSISQQDSAPIGKGPSDDETLESKSQTSRNLEASADSTSFEVVKKFFQKGWLVIVACMLAGVGIVFWNLTSQPRPGDPQTSQSKTASPAGTPEALTKAELTQRGNNRLARYDREGNISSAIDDFQRALTVDSSFAPALAGLAHAYWLDFRNVNRDPARLEQASAAAERAVSLDPFLAGGWISRAMARIEQNSLDGAQQDLEKALELEPLNADAWFGLAKVAEIQSRPELAEQHYRKAIELRPDTWIYLSALGNLYFDLGKYRAAEQAFTASLEQAQGNYLSHRNLGTVYYLQGRLDEAATQLQQALQIRPDTSVYTNLGNIYFTQGLYAEAAKAFEKSLDVGSAEYTQWANLADAYRWIPGAGAKAEAAYRQAIALIGQRTLDSGNSPAAQSRLFLYRAKIGVCKDLPRDEDGMKELALNDPSAWYRLAIANEICKRRGPALAALEAALSAGYPVAQIQLDPELLKLRQDAQFHRLLLRLSPTEP